MRKLRAAVIGVGYLGNFHAQKYALCPDVDLVSVVDTDSARASEVAAKYGARAVTDYREVLPALDLVSIVVPPANHFEIARDCLDAGVHALVEKPVTERVEQAETLIALATERGLVLQVGHLERFNPVIRALRQHVRDPRRIETQRFSAYKTRGTEVDVVLDLMIHDIDIVLSLAAGPVRSVQSSGTAVITDSIDIAHARIEFESGLVAELAASRVSQEQTRKLKVVESNGYLELDYVNHELHRGVFENGRAREAATEVVFATAGAAGVDVLMDEIYSFVHAVRHDQAPEVSGEDGKRALELAIEISYRITRHRAVPLSPSHRA
ncbi:MAG: Gfo/Idh/MocA family oxidoreductase [Gammaproteobacteria bacterium]